MKVQVMAFGIARDILGGNTYTIEVAEKTSVFQLKEALQQSFPDFVKLASLAIAVNEEYASDDQLINANDEVVIIPPVAGG